MMAKKPISPASKPAAKATKKSSARDDGGFLAAGSAKGEPPVAVPMHPVPIPLSRVLGQPRAVALLQGSMLSERLHHAWIFYGPAGVGKLTTALAFASMLLDPTTNPTLSGELEADLDSQVQRLLRSGMHPDLHVITKELARFHSDAKIRDQKQRTIATDVIRDSLIGPATLAAAIAGKSRASKVFIVNEAELMNQESQNAMLKTLEEPPPGTVLILVTSAEHKLLPTIRSRGQRVPFGPLPADAMREWSKNVAPDLPGEEREWLTQFAAGSPGAFEMARQGGLFGWHTQLAPMLAKVDQGKYEIALAPTMGGLIDQWAEAWVKSHNNASKEAANHAGAEWLFRLLGDHFRGMLRQSALSGQVAGPVAMRMQRAADALELLEEAQRRLNANIGTGLVMEGLVADLVAVFNGEAVDA